MPHDPNLLRSLPAEKRYEIETSPEFVTLDRELKELMDKLQSEERGRQRRKLYTKRHKLMSIDLRKARESQECKQRNSQRLMSQQGLTILDPDPLSAPTTCLSTSDIEDRSPATPSTDLYSESFMTS
jgi:hypothetical protein